MFQPKVLLTDELTRHHCNLCPLLPSMASLCLNILDEEAAADDDVYMPQLGLVKGWDGDGRARRTY